ncbi:Early flowering [Musa troglodytarum]|uniref:Early flowering n=1 Tax=Musa troglodytarum TaxID=320322 RepID=A0A9E7KQY7_9LILI|nr:Early flowering [Musa troglodytarum]
MRSIRTTSRRSPKTSTTTSNGSSACTMTSPSPSPSPWRHHLRETPKGSSIRKELGLVSEALQPKAPPTPPSLFWRNATTKCSTGRETNHSL